LKVEVLARRRARLVSKEVVENIILPAKQDKLLQESNGLNSTGKKSGHKQQTDVSVAVDEEGKSPPQVSDYDIWVMRKEFE